MCLVFATRVAYTGHRFPANPCFHAEKARTDAVFFLSAELARYLLVILSVNSKLCFTKSRLEADLIGRGVHQRTVP